MATGNKPNAVCFHRQFGTATLTAFLFIIIYLFCFFKKWITNGFYLTTRPFILIMIKALFSVCEITDVIVLSCSWKEKYEPFGKIKSRLINLFTY